eukprot:460248-Prorocentrum_minimum.AAC.1
MVTAAAAGAPAPEWFHSSIASLARRRVSADRTALPYGVQINLPVSFTAGMHCIYDQPYCHNTSREDLDPPGKRHLGTHLFVCARRIGDARWAVGAAGERGAVLTPTSSEHEAREHNGAYWYHLEEQAFGFSATREVGLFDADVVDSHGDGRLSWHMCGMVGGWRCGGTQELMDSRTYRKCVFAFTPRSASGPAGAPSAAAADPLVAGYLAGGRAAYDNCGPPGEGGPGAWTEAEDAVLVLHAAEVAAESATGSCGHSMEQLNPEDLFDPLGGPISPSGTPPEDPLGGGSISAGADSAPGGGLPPPGSAAERGAANVGGGGTAATAAGRSLQAGGDPSQRRPLGAEAAALVRRRSRAAAQARFAVLQLYNKTLAPVLHMIDFEAARSPGSLAATVVAGKGRLFPTVKAQLLQHVLAHTAARAEARWAVSPSVRVNRGAAFLAARRRAPGDAALTVCGQLFRQLFDGLTAAALAARLQGLRRGDSLWHTVFEGEGGADHGGLFRESVRCLCSELQSPALPALAPCPNQVHGVGFNRDTWLPAPLPEAGKGSGQAQAGLPQAALLEFLGLLMGGTLRTCNPLEVSPPTRVRPSAPPRGDVCVPSPRNQYVAHGACSWESW